MQRRVVTRAAVLLALLASPAAAQVYQKGEIGMNNALCYAGPNSAIDCGMAPSGQYAIDFQPGPLSSVTAAKGGFTKLVRPATVDNIMGSALTLVCAGNPTVTLFNCGASATCAAPVAVGTVTLTGAGTVSAGTVTSPAAAAGDILAWAITAGTCVSVNLAATAQLH